MVRIIAFFMLGLLFFACSSSENLTSGDKDYKTVELDDNEVSPENNLESYLNRVAGVRVNGSGQNATVQVRGVNSFSGNTQPLFIVNGTDVGKNYSTAAGLVRNMKIKSVKVLKDSDASFYGVRGAGGVIVIVAK